MTVLQPRQVKMTHLPVSPFDLLANIASRQTGQALIAGAGAEDMRSLVVQMMRPQVGPDQHRGESEEWDEDYDRLEGGLHRHDTTPAL